RPAPGAGGGAAGLTPADPGWPGSRVGRRGPGQVVVRVAPPAGRPRHTTGPASRVLGLHSTITQPPKPAPVTRAPYTPGTPRTVPTSSSSTGVDTSKSSRMLAWLATISSPA